MSVRSRSIPLRRLFAACFAAVLALGACGGDDDSDSGSDGGDVTTTVAEPDGEGGSGTPGVDGSTVTVVGRDISLEPTELTVPSGEELTFVFVNEGELPHNLQITDGADFAVATEIETGPVTQELSATLPAPGEYEFFCEVHPAQMTGTLTAT